MEIFINSYPLQLCPEVNQEHLITVMDAITSRYDQENGNGKLQDGLPQNFYKKVLQKLGNFKY